LGGENEKLKIRNGKRKTERLPQRHIGHIVNET
jgi:hypothetical protein